MSITTYKGVEINVDSYGIFSAQIGKDHDDEITAKTLEDLKGRIDRANSAEAKRIKVKLPAVGLLELVNYYDRARGRDCELHAGNITGINRTTRDLQLDNLPKGYKLDEETVLADTPENRKMLQQLIVARKLMDTVAKRRLWNGGYGRIDADEYGDKLDEIVKKHAAQMAEAKS